MFPGFISLESAKRIAAAGKSGGMVDFVLRFERSEKACVPYILDVRTVAGWDALDAYGVGVVQEFPKAA